MNKTEQTRIQTAVENFADFSKKAAKVITDYIGSRTIEKAVENIRERKAEVKAELKAEKKLCKESDFYQKLTDFESALLMRLNRAKKEKEAKSNNGTVKSSENGEKNPPEKAEEVAEITEDDALNRLRFATSVLKNRFDWNDEQIIVQIKRVEKVN